MKIPETSANVGAYYSNEENGQWQPNGVIIDSGVGGGVVGSGDAGVHRPPVYPVHIPRGHIPGYVMAGAYYPQPYPPAPPVPQDDFADYMWMENEEEFDKQVMQQLEEEALMEQCIEAMLEDEQREQRCRPVANGHNHYPTTSNGSGSLSLEEAVSRSTLNPLAAEFVPNRARQPPEERQQEKSQERTQEKQPERQQGKQPERQQEKQPERQQEKQPERQEKQQERKETQQERTEENSELKTDVKTEVESAKELPEPSDSVDGKEVIESCKTEESIPTPTETPEVSAADVIPIDNEKKQKETKKDAKKTEVRRTKVDVKPKMKTVVVKTETKVQPKKKDSVKVVKSEVTVAEQKEESKPVAEVVKQSTPPVTEESTTPGIKPINYAAAAKANKPRTPNTPPLTEKTSPQPKTEKPTKPAERTEKKPPLKDSKVKTDKSNPKSEKLSVQRKNSTK